MSAESIGALVGLAVYFGMRLIDRLLPPDTHFSFMDKVLRRNEPKDDTDG